MRKCDKKKRKAFLIGRLLCMIPFHITFPCNITAHAMTASQPAQLQPYQSSYLSLLLSSNILKFGGPFTLKSGRQSPYFFNAGLFCTGESIASIASCYAQRIVESGIEFDVIFGPAYKVGLPVHKGEGGPQPC